MYWFFFLVLNFQHLVYPWFSGLHFLIFCLSLKQKVEEGLLESFVIIVQNMMDRDYIKVNISLWVDPLCSVDALTIFDSLFLYAAYPLISLFKRESLSFACLFFPFFLSCFLLKRSIFGVRILCRKYAYWSQGSLWPSSVVIIY